MNILYIYVFIKERNSCHLLSLNAHTGPFRRWTQGSRSSIKVSSMDGRSPIAGAITADSLGLHQYEAGIQR